MELCPRLRSVDIGRTVEFESGKLPYQEHGKPESILDVALNFGIQLEHACGGSCACTTCHVHMKTGAEVNLSPMDDDELDRVETAGDLTLESRLGCQAVVKGDVVVADACLEPQLRQRRRRLHESWATRILAAREEIMLPL